MGILEIAGQIIFCLLVAAILGWIVGFLLGRIFGSANAAELLKESEGKARMREQELSGLRSDLMASNGRLNVLQTEIASLAATVKTRDQWLSEMEAKQQELQQDLDARISELDELKAETDQEKVALQQQLETLQAALQRETNDFKIRLAEAEAAAQLARQQQANLTREQAQQRSEWEAKYAALGQEKEKEITRLKVRITELEMMARTIKEPVVKVATASALPPAPRERDDLQRIIGIGPKLESLLNEHGVFWFRQIAAWSPEDIARYSELLPQFHGRIERDGWIDSARAEHQKKYGEQL